MFNALISTLLIFGGQGLTAPEQATSSGSEIAAQTSSLHLICDGTGVDTRVGTAFASAYGSNGWANAQAYARKSSGFEDELEVEIEGSSGKARLPRRIVPKLHGGENGWFEIKKLAVGPDEISGKVAMNFTNAPYLRINRVSGAVSIDGRDGSFSGQCRNYSPDSVHHAF